MFPNWQSGTLCNAWRNITLEFSLQVWQHNDFCHPWKLYKRNYECLWHSYVNLHDLHTVIHRDESVAFIINIKKNWRQICLKHGFDVGKLMGLQRFSNTLLLRFFSSKIIIIDVDVFHKDLLRYYFIIHSIACCVNWMLL